MKIVRTLAEQDCPNGIDCAKVHEAAGGNLLVRGYIVSAVIKARHLLSQEQDAVSVPGEVYRDALAAPGGGALAEALLEELPDGSVLLAGTVLPAGGRDALGLPDHEDAVLVPLSEEVPTC